MCNILNMYIKGLVLSFQWCLMNVTLILIATFIMHHIWYTTPSSGQGWLDRVSSTVFIALGLGGRSVSFGDRNASLGGFRFEGNWYREMLWWLKIVQWFWGNSVRDTFLQIPLVRSISVISLISTDAPLYKAYRYVPPQRVRFFAVLVWKRLKTFPICLESGIVFEGATVVYEHICQVVLND